jgi:hypothetical protein
MKYRSRQALKSRIRLALGRRGEFLRQEQGKLPVWWMLQDWGQVSVGGRLYPDLETALREELAPRKRE